LSARTNLLRAGSPIATNAALLLFGLLTIELCRTGVGEFHHFVHGFSETVFGQLALYLGAISLIERCPTNKWTLRIVLVVALAARLICVFAPPHSRRQPSRFSARRKHLSQHQPRRLRPHHLSTRRATYLSGDNSS
jgi:hypothetical protein